MNVGEEIKLVELEKVKAELEKVKAETKKIEAEYREKELEITKAWYKRETGLKFLISLALGAGVLKFYADFIIKPIWEKDTISAELSNIKISKELELERAVLFDYQRKIKKDSELLIEKNIEFQNSYKFALSSFERSIDSVGKLVRSGRIKEDDMLIMRIVEDAKSAANKVYLKSQLFKYDFDTFLKGYQKSFGMVGIDVADRLRNILKYSEKYDIELSVPQIAYIFSSIKWETGGAFLPLEEVGKGKGRPWGVNKNGVVYYGRGFVPICYYEMYRTFGEIFQLDLVSTPDMMLDPELSYRATSIGMAKGLFSGKKLSDFISESQKDYVNARRVINGVDHAWSIALDAQKFEEIISKSVKTN